MSTPLGSTRTDALELAPSLRIIDYLYAHRQEFVESWPKAPAATNGLLYDPGSGHYLHYLRAPAVVPR